MNVPIRQVPQPAAAPLRDGIHYFHLLKRVRWYLIATIPLVLFAALAIVFLVIRPENPELTAQALIGLERATETAGLKPGVAATLGREDIMMSRIFLRDVVKKLSLQLWTVPRSRSDLFDSIFVDSTAPCGTYSVRSDPQKSGGFVIYYYDTTAISLPVYGFLPGSRFKIAASGLWSAAVPVSMPGITVKFNRSLRGRPRAFSFQIVDIRVAVESVYRNLTIKRADPDKGINYITVLVASRDYATAAATANAIADGFIAKNSSFREQRTLGVVSGLDRQLRLSQTNLAAAESKIRDFRSNHPQVGLNLQTQQTVSSLAQLDNGIQNASSEIAEAARMKNAFLELDSTLRPQLAREITERLAVRGVPAGRTLQDELARLLAQRQQFNTTYGAEHPMVLENSRAVKRTVWLIYAALDDYLDNTQSALSRKKQNSQQMSGKLRNLPALEMQLGELQRNQKIFADIYSAVLNSYNQAKVADAVETTDFYMMDYAVAPLPPPVDRTQYLVMAVLLALLAGFGPVLIADLADKSVRSQRQLSRVTGKLVLEAVPVFFTINPGNRRGNQAPRHLINAPCNPNYTREIFDSLLVKIKLRLFDSTDHSIAVSGFEGGSGKSTISANLAMVIALRGHRTILIDGDLRCGTVKETFRLADTAGLAGLLAGHAPFTDEECNRSIMETVVPNLFVLPAGREPPDPGVLLASPRMVQFKRFCEKHFDFIIMDTPPLGIVSDAVVVEKLFAHYIFVVRSGQTQVAELVDRINEFESLSEKIIGYVLNAASHDAVGTYRRYSKYYTR